MSELKTYKPDMPPEMWVEQPAVAADRMNHAAEEAASYTGPAAIAALGLLGTMLTSFVIKKAAGPYGGILEAVIGIFKKPEEEKEK